MTFRNLTSALALCFALGFGCGSVEGGAKAGETVLHTEAPTEFYPLGV